MIITENDKDEIKRLEKKISEFEMKNLDGLNYFLRIKVTRDKKEFIYPRKNILVLLTETVMVDCKLVDTPTIPNLKLEAFSDHTPTCRKISKIG
jgi:hypothetical protein